ncbi:hypothetical protein CA260_17950 [Dyella jiangningensis]|uniref:Uncharacterized protein n=1 Tax=Dyella jiangningensis TaxID=1379159 RepID=A0A328P1M9_9GAMM|nr:hypothetical protein CA260_17950 [Dyella jiangningensis]
MSRSQFFQMTDCLLVLLGVAVIYYFLRCVYRSLREGHVMINGQMTTQKESPGAFWMTIISWLALSGIVVWKIVEAVPNILAP